MELFKLFGTIAINNRDANSAIDETTDKAEDAESKFSSAFKKIGEAVATYFAIEKIISFGKEITNVAAEVSAEASAFDQIMGDYADEASAKVEKIADATGMVSTRLTPYMTSMTAKFKGLGYDIDDATTLASEGLNIAADAAAFWDKSLADSMSALNSFINGSYEGGEAIGLFANDTQMASYAVRNNIVSETKEWANLDEAKKQATRLEYAQAMFEASGAVGQAAKESEQYANVQANLTEKWRQFKAQIGEPLLENVVLPALQKLSELTNKASEAFEKLKTWISENKDELLKAADSISKLAEIAVYATGVFATFKAGLMLQKVIQGFQVAKIEISLLSTEIGGANLAQDALNGTMTIGETIVALLTGKMTLAALAQGAMTKAQTALNAVMAANPIALIVLAIAALVAAFIYLWNNCEGFRNFFIKMWDGIKKAAKAVADWFVQAWEDIGKFFTETVPGWFNSFVEFFEGIWNGIKDFFIGVWNSISNFFIELWNSIVEIFTSIVNWIITNIAEPIANFYNKWISPVVNKIIEIVTKIVEIIISLFVGLWNLLKEKVIDPIVEGFRWLWETVLGFFTSLWERIKIIWKAVSAWFKVKVIDPIVNFFTELFEKVKKAFTQWRDNMVEHLELVAMEWQEKFEAVREKVIAVFNKLKNAASNAWEGIKKPFLAVGSWFKDVFQKAYDAVTGVFDKIGTFFSNIWDKIKNTFSKLGTTISDAIGGAIKSGINGIIGSIEKTINRAIGLINGAIGLINLLPGVNVSKISQLSMPRLAKGGIVDKATIAEVGEDGREAIVPLERNTGWMNEVAERLNQLQKQNGGTIDNGKILDKLNELIVAIKALKIYLYPDTLIGELADGMDTQLGIKNRLRARGQ